MLISERIDDDVDDDDDDDYVPCDDGNDSDPDGNSDDEEEDMKKFPWWILLIIALLLLLMLFRLILFLLGLLLLLLLLLLLMLIAGLLVTPALMLVSDGDSESRGVFERYVMPLVVMVAIVVTVVMVLVMKKREWYNAIMDAVDAFQYWWDRVGSLSKNTLLRFMPKKVGLLESAQQTQQVMVLVLTCVLLVLVNVVVVVAVLLVGGVFGRTMVLLMVLMAIGAVLWIDVQSMTWYGVARYVIDILRSAAQNQDQLRAFKEFMVLRYLLNELQGNGMDTRKLLSKLAMWLMAMIVSMELVVMPILAVASDMAIRVLLLGIVAGMAVFVKRKELIEENQMEYILRMIKG